jgi:pyridoxal 5'-phosphate synthase pdxT subunit
MKIGVLGYQGSVEEHITALQKLGIETIRIKDSFTLSLVQGIILPGGESTNHIKLLKEDNVFEDLKNSILKGLPVFATCAGIVILAKEIINYSNQDTMKVLDVSIIRNGYGPQLDSFSEDVNVKCFNDQFKAVFIRAPLINKTGSDVEVLAKDSKGNPVFIRQGKIMGMTFHPELTIDLRIHELFINSI